MLTIASCKAQNELVDADLNSLVLLYLSSSAGRISLRPSITPLVHVGIFLTLSRANHVENLWILCRLP